MNVITGIHDGRVIVKNYSKGSLPRVLCKTNCSLLDYLCELKKNKHDLLLNRKTDMHKTIHLFFQISQITECIKSLELQLNVNRR